MHIWVDADACPGEVKQLLFRTAERRKVKVTLVANQPMRVPPSKFVDSVLVSGGLDVADEKIVELAQTDDLVITADIPLAAKVVEKGAQALDPRGTLFDEDNIAEKLAMRNLMSELRDSGLVTGGPASFGSKDRQEFANQLDRWISRASR